MKRVKAPKRSKAKPARKARARLAPENSLDVPVEISDVREKIIKIVENEATQMVKSTVAQVRNGHYLAMKYLFEMAGLFPARAPAPAESEESLTKTLLLNLGLLEENGGQELDLQTKVTKEKCSSANEATSHAVK